MIYFCSELLDTVHHSLLFLTSLDERKKTNKLGSGKFKKKLKLCEQTDILHII